MKIVVATAIWASLFVLITVSWENPDNALARSQDSSMVSSAQTCSPSPSNNFLFLPYDTGVYGDWLDRMTSAFDHHYPDYTCSMGMTSGCQQRGMEIALWEGELARPVYINNTPYCYSPGNNTSLTPSVCGYISGYESVTGEGSAIYYDGHNGYDWALPGGDVPILAASSGVITGVGDEGDYGWTITIDHLIGYTTKYSHLKWNSQTWGVGDCVDAGMQIGIQGDTGKGGTHLHFRVYHNGKITDPFGWCYYCTSPPPDPLSNYNGESSQNLWHGTNPHSVGRVPTRPNIGIIWNAFNTQYLGGPGLFAPEVDNILPSGYFTSPSNGATITERTVTVSVEASDNPGGSGVKEVRFSAAWDGQWRGIGEDSSYPYSIEWDMCSSGVAPGDVELGMEVWDNANNKWVYSEHYPNPHITMNYACDEGNPQPGGSWNTQAWQNRYLAGDPNWVGTFTWDNGNYPYIVFDYASGAPFGWGGDEFSMRFWRNVYFPGGYYEFHSDHDDGVRVYVDNIIWIDAWWDGYGGHDLARNIDAGWHEVKVEYYENTGDSNLSVVWYGPGYPRPDYSPPSGRITSPSNPAYINTLPLHIVAEATDDASGVDYVEFHAYYCQSGQCEWHHLGNDGAPPYVFDWDWSDISEQKVWLTIHIYDKTGKEVMDPGGYVEVDLDRTPPNVSIQSPLDDDWHDPGIIPIQISASDEMSGVEKVQFFVGYHDASPDYWREIGWDEDGSDGWSFDWDSGTIGEGTPLAFFVYAYDRALNINGDVVWNNRIGAPNPPLENVLYLPLLIK